MKEFSKKFIILIIGIVLGALLLNYINSKPLVSQPAESNENLQINNVRSKLQHLTDSEIKDYLKLKTDREKFLKANDILAKIMVIFLADLGLRINSNDIEKIETLSNDYVLDNTVSDLKERIPVPEKQSLVSSNKNSLMAVVPSNENITQDWKKVEKKISEINSDSEIDDFLKKVEIKEFFKEISSAQRAGRRTLGLMRGVFTGTLEYFDKETEAADVFLELDGYWEKGKIQGSNKLILSRHGEPFSNSSGEGDLENYKKITGARDAHFIELGGRSGFLQLYFNSDSSAFGNYYQQKSVNQFELAGRVRLQKR
jgi:hypothetical protein